MFLDLLFILKIIILKKQYFQTMFNQWNASQSLQNLVSLIPGGLNNPQAATILANLQQQQLNSQAAQQQQQQLNNQQASAIAANYNQLLQQQILARAQQAQNQAAQQQVAQQQKQNQTLLSAANLINVSLFYMQVKVFRGKRQKIEPCVSLQSFLFAC